MQPHRRPTWRAASPSIASAIQRSRRHTAMAAMAAMAKPSPTNRNGEAEPNLPLRTQAMAKPSTPAHRDGEAEPDRAMRHRASGNEVSRTNKRNHARLRLGLDFG